MPVFVFNTTSELMAHIQSVIEPNGTQDITGQVHQDVLLTAALSLVNIISSVPPASVNEFPAWEALDLYEGGIETIVRHSGKLWLFVSGSDDTGTTPGTNALIWSEISAAQLSHFRNRDQFLDQGGTYQVSAQEIWELLNATVTSGLWIPPVQGYGYANETAADALSRTRVVVIAGTGLFLGQNNKIANKSGGVWTFEDVPVGAVVLNLENNLVLFRKVTGWHVNSLVIPNLADVMAVGNGTGGTALKLDCGMIRMPQTVNHTVAGTFSHYMSNRSRLYIQVGANLTLTFTGVVYGTDIVIELRGMGAYNLTFDSTVVFADGITAPTVTVNLQTILLMAHATAGKVCITQVTKFTALY